MLFVGLLYVHYFVVCPWIPFLSTCPWIPLVPRAYGCDRRDVAKAQGAQGGGREVQGVEEALH